MSQSYYQGSLDRPATMTVSMLIQRLQALPDQEAEVIFKSPKHGCYGPDQAYSVDKVTAQSTTREVRHYPAGVRFDDETGEEERYEAWDDVTEAWSGVVIE